MTDTYVERKPELLLSSLSAFKCFTLHPLDPFCQMLPFEQLEAVDSRNPNSTRNNETHK